MCDQYFDWCCAGYGREPRANLVQAGTGHEIDLSVFCGDCIAALDFRLGLPMTSVHVLAQEDDYYALVRCFEGVTNLKWVPMGRRRVLHVFPYVEGVAATTTGDR